MKDHIFSGIYQMNFESLGKDRAGPLGTARDRFESKVLAGTGSWKVRKDGERNASLRNAFPK